MKKETSGLVAFINEHAYMITIIAMFAANLALTFYTAGALNSAVAMLMFALSLVTVKALIVSKHGDIIKQVKQWLFEVGIFLFYAGITVSSINPVFAAVILIMSVLFFLMFTLLAVREVLRLH